MVVTSTPVIAQLQTGRDLAEDGAEIGAECRHNDHRGNGNQCCDQTVLDRRNSFFVFDQAAQGQ